MRSVKSFLLIGVGPTLVDFLVLGAVLMVIWRVGNPDFFRRRTEVADAGLIGR